MSEGELFGDDDNELASKHCANESGEVTILGKMLSLPVFLQEFAILMVRNVVSSGGISFGGCTNNLVSSSISE